MKKQICLLLALLMLSLLCGCGGAQSEQAPAPEASAWTREGYYSNEAGNMLSVTWMSDTDEPGWYVGFTNGEDWVEDSYGGILPQVGDTLHGTVSSSGAKGDLTVTVSEEGEDGLQVTVESGETYHFTVMEMPKATIFVSINTEGLGNIDYAEGEAAPEIDPEHPFQSAQINLAEPTTHTFVAWPQAGNVFVKWTKNGQDFSTEPQITVLLDESADFIAVFEEDPDWQNPVMNFVGEYQCGKAHAGVECFGYDEAWITVEWGSSVWELTRWIIVGRLDPETLTISYEGASKANLVYGEDGEVKSEESVYDDGTGTVAFHEDGTFLWHEDQSEQGMDMLFTRVPAGSGDIVRQDGEHFESVIFLEGMEETVQYEHIRNEALGFEMDYDYEFFERRSEASRELFVSVYDDPDHPENYLELTYRAEDAEAVAASVRSELSQTYDLIESARELDRMGSCLYIEASELKGTGRMADQLQFVYIIPAPVGCFVAAEHVYIVGSEGFGHRFHDMLNTLAAIEAIAPSPEAFRIHILTPAVSFHPGTAGSSLGRAQAASEIISAAVDNQLRFVNQDRMNLMMEEAYAQLSEEEQAWLPENLPGLIDLIDAAYAEYGDVSGTFEDAGVGSQVRLKLGSEGSLQDWTRLRAAFAHLMDFA